jgi:hypothetical protein
VVRHLALSPLPSDPFPKTSGCDSLIESVWIVLVQDGGDVNLGENALITAKGGFFSRFQIEPISSIFVPTFGAEFRQRGL